jgi:hypothetical protein
MAIKHMKALFRAKGTCFHPSMMVYAFNPICGVKKLLMEPISHLKAKDYLERIYILVQGLVPGP